MSVCHICLSGPPCCPLLSASWWGVFIAVTWRLWFFLQSYSIRSSSLNVDHIWPVMTSKSVLIVFLLVFVRQRHVVIKNPWSNGWPNRCTDGLHLTSVFGVDNLCFPSVWYVYIIEIGWSVFVVFGQIGCVAVSVVVVPFFLLGLKMVSTANRLYSRMRFIIYLSCPFWYFLVIHHCPVQFSTLSGSW